MSHITQIEAPVLFQNVLESFQIQTGLGSINNKESIKCMSLIAMKTATVMTDLVRQVKFPMISLNMKLIF